MNVDKTTLNSSNRKASHCSSQVTLAKALYLASEELLEMVACFLDFHEINEEPR